MSVPNGATRASKQNPVPPDIQQRRLVDGSRPAELLLDRSRPAIPSGKAHRQDFEIRGSDHSNIQRFCAAHEVAPLVVLFAAFRATHYRLTGVDDAVIGGLKPGQPCCDLIRTTIHGDSFGDLLRQIQLAVSKAHVDDERGSSNWHPKKTTVGRQNEIGSFLVRMLFSLHSHSGPNASVGNGVESGLDLDFQLCLEEDRISGTVFFSADIFDPETITSMLDVFSEIAQQGIKESRTAVDALPLLSGRTLLGDMGLLRGETTDYPRESSIVEVFLQQVRTHPHAIAVKDSSTQLTYTQLDGQSNELAQWVARQGLAPETPVAVLAPRSCETIVAFLGILKANMCYLPLDVNNPAGRIETILSSLADRKLVLVGTGVALPTLQQNDVALKFITRALEEQTAVGHEEPTRSVLPSATSLAYVMFTSGSTGRPKGVMIEHRSVVRLVKKTNVIPGPGPIQSVAHAANITFDASTWEIYTAILNGGTLICVDAMTVLDCAALGEVFARESVRIATFPPALLKQCLREAPSAIAGLDVLFMGGDRLHPRDALRAQELVAGCVINGFGPTENTVASTIYRIDSAADYTNGVPIGRAFTNSGAFVMDSYQRLVPLGVLGELVVTGDGVARGYTDSCQDVGRFTEIKVDGRVVKAYRTGDCARHRPKDGELEFFGRMDQQAKIRGHRVELAEIEHILLSHSSVSDAVALISTQDCEEHKLFGFVTVQDSQDGTKMNGSTGSSRGEGRSREWIELFDAIQYRDVDTIDVSRLGKDFKGWTSMYDGSEIDHVEMEEWLDDTIATVLNGGSAGNVLEIGTGTGMILFNILKGLESYIGLEPASKAAAFVTRMTKSMPEVSNKVRIHIGTATDLCRLSGHNSPNLVVVNSVMQFFPSEDYLFQVIEDILRLQSPKQIFFGDVRSYALYREFQATKALHSATATANKRLFSQNMAETESLEEELLVDPAFFTALRDRLPELIEHVEIIPKRMRATNELSSYRYAAVLHTKRSVEQPIHHVKNEEWVDCAASKLNRQSLLALLMERSHLTFVAVANIPNSKTILERTILDALEGEDEERMLDDQTWLSFLRQKAEASFSLSAIDLREISRIAGFKVEISWARQFSQRGGFDAIFHRVELQNPKSRVLFQFPTDHQGRGSLTNWPLQRKQNRELEKQLREKVRSALPSYMVPEVIRILDKMPINANGKVDRESLAKIAPLASGDRDLSSLSPPRNDLERALCEEFAHVLDSSVGIDDNFFDLGGHSLIATRVASRIRKRLGTGITVKDIFDCPTISGLACRINPSIGSKSHIAIPRSQESGPVEQTLAQERLLRLERSRPGSTSYLMPFAMRLRGPLQLRALNAARLALEERHETLRTTFEQQGGMNVQIVRPFQPTELTVISASEQSFMSELRRDQTTPFVLERESGWRVSVFRLGEEDHVLSVIMHHVISDAWSIEILRHELSTFYSAYIRKLSPLSQVNPLSLQFRDFAVWEKHPAQMLERQRQLEYWIEQLEGSEAATLPYDNPRPAVLSGKADAQEVVFQASVYSNLQRFCKAHRVTPFIVLLATFRAAQYRITGAADATIGTPIANRSHQELEGLIGFFVNLHCIRSKIQQGHSFGELIAQIQAAVTAAIANQDVPFDIPLERITAQERSEQASSRLSLVRMLFAFHSQLDLDQFALEGVRVQVIGHSTTTRMDLEMQLYQEENGLGGTVLYSTDLFGPQTIAQLLSTFSEVLERGIEDPDASIDALRLTGDSLAR